MDHYYKDDFSDIEKDYNEKDYNVENNEDTENESDTDKSRLETLCDVLDNVYNRLNNFMADHLGFCLSLALIILISVVAVPFGISLYYSQDKYLETKSDTTLAYTIVDKTMTTYGSGDNMRSYYHIVVKNPETGTNKAFSCTSGLYASIVVGEPLNIRERVVYNTHYKTTSTKYTANGTNLYG